MLEMLGFRVWQTSQPQRAMMSPGLPDLVVFHPRRKLFFFWETKAAGGKLSEAQLDFLAACAACGVPHGYGGLAEAKAFLVQQGVIAQP
jgi:hypothetical protein